MLLPEILYASSDSWTSQKLSKWQAEGQIRKLVPKVYTSNFTDDDSAIIKRNIWPLLGHLYPNCLISHRSALEYRPSPAGNLYLTANSRRVIKWPGLHLRFAEGPQPLESDRILFPAVRASSLERACLENLRPSRKRNAEKRTVDQAIIEKRLLSFLETRGENKLNNFREKAREISIQFDWPNAFKQLNKIISTLLSTHEENVLVDPETIAFQKGRPYDGGRFELFQHLQLELLRTEFRTLPESTLLDIHYRNFAFYESYFSNYIEGTIFSIEEAEDIIYEGLEIPNRSGDSHDIRGSYQICSDREEMNIEPLDCAHFIRLIKARHKLIMAGRPKLKPGQFKRRANRAGNTFFVDPAKVLGTVEQAFKLLQGLEHPFSRAIFMMFALSEIHPFTDGNGRLARIMMNAELSRAGQSKIIIPTVYRSDYLLNLRQLSRKGDTPPFVRMMYRIWQYSHWLQADDLGSMEAQLRSTNAFMADDEGVIIFPTHI